MKDKNTLVIILVVFVALVVLYFVASPYQNCIRQGISVGHCLRLTSW